MDAYRVIRHPGDEDEGARWGCRARQQRGPVEIASGPTPAALRLGRTWPFCVDRGRNLLIPPLVGAASRPAKRACAREWKSWANGRRKSRTRLKAGTNCPRSLKPKGGSAGGVLVRERRFFGFNRYA